MFHVAICEVSRADPVYRDDPWCSHDSVFSFSDKTRKQSAALSAVRYQIYWQKYWNPPKDQSQLTSLETLGV